MQVLTHIPDLSWGLMQPWSQNPPAARLREGRGDGETWGGQDYDPHLGLHHAPNPLPPSLPLPFAATWGQQAYSIPPGTTEAGVAEHSRPTEHLPAGLLEEENRPAIAWGQHPAKTHSQSEGEGARQRSYRESFEEGGAAAGGGPEESEWDRKIVAALQEFLRGRDWVDITTPRQINEATSAIVRHSGVRLSLSLSLSLFHVLSLFHTQTLSNSNSLTRTHTPFASRARTHPPTHTSLPKHLSNPTNPNTKPHPLESRNPPSRYRCRS
jgi:hypothetical protein